MTHIEVERLEGLNIGAVKPQVQMTVIDGKLSVLNLVQFTASKEEVAEDNFFGSIDAKPKDEYTVNIPIIVDPTSGNAKLSSLGEDWFKNDVDSKFNIDKYPEEMAEIISKNIKMNKDIAGQELDVILFDVNKPIPLEYADIVKQGTEMAEKAYKDLIVQVKKYRSIGAADVGDMLERYAFRKHIMIQGEKGGGKTFEVDAMIEANGYKSEFIAGHEGIESIDLLGYYVKTESGDLVWLDGVLSKAFRDALTSKTVLFIDETLRIPARELNILIGCLTPSSTGTYKLRTNRIVNIEGGIGESELLEIPVENLWFVGTTNVGAGYNVDEIDDAFADRVRLVNKENTMSNVADILTAVAGKTAVTSKVVDKLCEFYAQERDLVGSGELEKYVNVRHLSEVIQLAGDDSQIVEYMYDLIPTWTSMDTDGKPNKAERDIITKLIKRIFK